MGRVMWIIVGVAIGFVAAHFASRTPEGRRLLDQVNRGAREFGDAVASGYRDGEEHVGEALDEVQRRLRSLGSSS